MELTESDNFCDLRQRATAIVIRDGMLLLTRNRGAPSFSLPGGGVHSGELPIAAVARELHEETSLTATTISYLFEHSGKYNSHHVYRVDATSDVSLARDLDAFAWWDRASDLPLVDFVAPILGKL